jgi:hypothetical protein
MTEERRRVTFETEAGSPAIDEDVVIRLRDDLRARPGAFAGRELAAANAIDAALLSDMRVKFAYAEQLGVLGVLHDWEPLQDPELIALLAALRQMPSLTHEIGYERHPDELLDRLPPPDP